MTAVDPLFAQWLQDEGLWHVKEDADAVLRWGDRAITAERMTSIATKAGAVAEAERQLMFLGGPLVIEEHSLAGEWRSRRGQVITITGPHLGYEAGIDVFLLEADDDRATGLSSVAVLRRL